MNLFCLARARWSRIATLLLATTPLATALTVSGTVTDQTGARVPNARVLLVTAGKVTSEGKANGEGYFQINTTSSGRYFLLISAPGYRQLTTPDFYATSTDVVERSLVVEPEYVRQSIVVTANGTPTPQAQTSDATTVLTALDLAPRLDLVSVLGQVPGASVQQGGQRGSVTSLFLRGGNSNATKILLDGVDAGDMGNLFDFGPVSTANLESVEVYRGANSSLFGGGAGSGVVAMSTAHGTTSAPSLLIDSEGGNFNLTHDAATVAGSHRTVDYLGGFSWLQSTNATPRNAQHVATTTGNFGWQPNAATELRGTIHYTVDGAGQPNAWEFYHIADNATQKDQDLIVSAVLNHQTTAALHNTLRYGATRKRQQYSQWSEEGLIDGFGDGLGQQVTISGANGYKVTGQAILDYAGSYPYHQLLVSNRDALTWQGDYRFNQHLTALGGFRFEDERGVENIPAYFIADAADRTNYVYNAAVHGDVNNRFFYHLGGALEHYALFGTQTTPRAGFTVYALKPSKHVLSGTRLLANYGDGVREAKLTDEFGSLYKYLGLANDLTLAKQLHIAQLAAPTTRTYEAGVEQGLFSDRVLFRASYFHNQFGREIESVPAMTLVKNLSLTADERANLIKALGTYYTYNYGVYTNSQSFKAQGIESTVEAGLGRALFLRGGYTYLDAVVQRSFTSDNLKLASGLAPTPFGIPTGWTTPLVGARPFRRPPHMGFFNATYAEGKLTGQFTASFASRADDSTYLYDQYYGNSLLLPNRNLDHGFARLDIGGSYRPQPWISFFLQGENLTSNQHLAPIGYTSLPFTFRSGVRLALGGTKK